MNRNPKPLKRFGQNYLVDQNTVKKIVTEFNPKSEDVILEIGPGRGVLTNHLDKCGATVMAIEIDKRVIDDLKDNFVNVEFIRGDILKFDFNSLSEGKKLRIIGNIPYNITSPILFKIIDNLNLVNDALFMVQYEVAKRIVAEPRTKDYGILSVILNHFFTVELCFKVPPTVFYPKPKVDSAIIKFTTKKVDDNFDNKLFITVVKGAFGNRRKNLKNSYSNSILSAYDFTSFPVELTKRAEELKVSDYLKIYNFFKDKINERTD